MAVDVSIRFRAESGAAKREIEQLQQEIRELRQQLGSTQTSATETGTEVKQLGDQSRQTAQSVDKLTEEARAAAVGVTSLGRNIFKTSAEAKRFGGVFADVTGRLHEANGQYAQTSARIDTLGDEARESASEVQKLGNTLEDTGRGASGFSRGVAGAEREAGRATKAIGLLGSVARETLTTFGAFAAVDMGYAIGRVGIESVQAAGQLEQLTRATTQIEGSAEAAAQRMVDLREIADLPGLNFEPLTRYSNRLRAAGVSAADTNTILLTVGQTILSLGGSSAAAALSMEQLIQAIQLGKVDFRDFRTIVQQIPGFLEALGDVHGVEASIEGLHDAFEQVGGSIIDILIPTFEELERRFESPPLDSYIVRMDALQNAFFHTQAAIGDLFLPTVTEGARVLTEFLEAIRVGTEDLTTLPKPIQEIIAGAQHLYESLKRVGEGILRGLGPSVSELVKQLGGLLGQVLELAGALLTALEPILTGTAYALGVITAAAAQLVDQVGALIGGLADAVEWLAFWSDEGDKATTATENLAAAQNDLRTAAESATQAVEGATQALGGNASAGDQARAKLKILTAQLETTSSTIERYEERLKRAQAASNTSDIDFYTRGLKTQRERAAALTAEISKLSETYGDAGANLGENATALEQQEARLKDLRTELQSANQEYERLDGLLGKAKDMYVSEASPAVEQYQRRVTAAEQAVSEIRVEIEKTESQITKLKSATEAATDATDENTETVQQAKVEYIEYSAILERAHREIQAFEKAFSDLNAEAQGFGDFWRIASGQLEDYSESIQTTIPSIVNLTDAENALTAAIDANLQTLQKATGNPLSDYIDSLTLTSEAADAAFGSINRVGRSVRDADFRRAAAELRDFDDAFRLSEVTIPRVNSEMERFTGTLPDASRSIRDTTIALENLSQEARDAARDAEFLNASFSALDAFDLQTPDVNAPSFDTAGFALRTGEELASQAIRTAGELRRIEEERVENLADLEREYSERIIEINEEKRRKLAEVEERIEAERLRRLASIEQAFADAAAAEVAAREQAAARILQIEQKAAEDRERLRERLNDRLLELEQRRDARIQELNDGFIERERDRQEAILAVTEQAAAARLDAEQQYADRVQKINNRLVEDVLAIQRGLQEDIESLEEGFIDRQADRADEVVRITEEAAEARVAANQVFSETMQGIYNDLVEAWDDLEEGFLDREEDRAAERIAIEQDAADDRVAANEEYADTVARISADLVDEVRRLEAEIIDVQASAAADRIAIEQDAIDARAEANADYARELEALEKDRVSATADYAKRIARISTDLVDEVRGIQNEITEIISDATEDRLEIEQDGIDARAEANADYADRIAKIEVDTAAKLEENTRRLSEIHGEAVDDKLAVDEEYADRFQDIQNDLVDRVVDIQEDLNDTLNDLRDEQLEAEKDRLESLVELHEETQQKLEDLERERTQTVEDLRREYQQDQLDAATQLDRDLEDAEGDPEKEAAARQKFNRRIQDLTREFHRDILELRREQSRERDTIARQAAAREIQIAEEAQARQTEIAQQQVDARAAAQAGITAAEEAAGVSFLEAQENYVPALNAHEQALLAHAEALQQINAAEASGVAALEEERGEVLKASIDATATAAMTLSETLSAVTAAEQERLTELETQTAETIAGLQSQITEAESQAGLTFETALANYTPAVDLNTQALQALTSALDSISDAEVTAAQTLKDSLSAVTATEQERLAELETQTTGTLAGLNQQITDAETRTGLSFEAALANYTPAVDLNTQALQALTDALTAAEADRLSGLSDIAARGAADRATTTAAQQALETDAGVSIEEARLNYVPALSSATQATLTLNETIQALDASFRAAVAEIQTAGLVDRQAVDAAIQTAIADATAQQTALEAQAGTTFADASLAFQPGLSDIAQAGVDRDTAIDDIDQAEIEDIDAINAQAIADRLETDAAITETRDAYIKARDTEIFKHNVAMLQLNTAEAADIKAVRETLNKNLENIDEKLDLELAEIREQKVVFDARMNELITAINEQANQDVASLKEDTAAMRSSLEAIAAEAKDNAWKKALLKIASTGITIAGVAAGTALGNPVAGLAVGQAVGGVVEEAGNELFHFSQTDRIARNIARQSAYRNSRPAPNYLPDANQIRNAKDVSREIVAGLTEGLQQRERSSFGGASEQASLPEEITATIQIQFPDGSVQELRDQMVRLEQQDR